MKPDRNTYEAWLLDRIEGNLSPAQERELDALLAANPDLDASLGQLPVVGDDALPFDMKEELKKRFPPTGEIDAARLNDFLVAHLEGDLDKDQELALDKFLFEHPEHEQEAKRMAASKAAAARVPFENKPTIERHFPPQGLPDKHRLTDFLIAAQEGDLSKEQQRALANYLAAHTEARRDERLIAATKVPVERVVFSGKEGLKKREAHVIALWQRYAVAASIALLLGFAWWVMRVEKNDGPVVAETEKVQRPPGPEAETLREKAETLRKKAETLREKGEIPIAQEKTGPQGPGAVTRRERKAAGKQERKEQPVPSEEPVSPEPEPRFVERHLPLQLHPTPALAHAPPPAPKQDGEGTQVAVQPVEHPATASVSRFSEGGTPIGTVLANTVRSGMLETGERADGLDRDDALAMVNKGLGAITGGQGHVDVEPKGKRDRWKVRLGKNLAISASTGR